MTRKRFVFGHDKKLYPEGEFPEGIRSLYDKPPKYGRGPAIHTDFESFVSPLDGTVVSGRKQYRDHCKEHNVVPTQELKGLPPATAVKEHKPDSAAIKEELARVIHNK